MATTRATWFEDFFHGVANDLWRKFATPELNAAEADFLTGVFGAKARLLDVPCGNGRLSLELARRGCRVTGVDISKEFIIEATGHSTKSGVAAEWVNSDMRQLPWNAEFDGAFCWGNSFGYLEYNGMMAFVAGVARALKPGGRFVIDTGSVAESLLPTLKEREWYQVEDILFAIENRYLAAESCLETHATFVRNGQTETRTWWHWVYTAGEIQRLLAQAGLVNAQLFGGLDRRPFKLGCQHLLLIAEKGREQ